MVVGIFKLFTTIQGNKKFNPCHATRLKFEIMKNVSALLFAFFATVFSMNANSVDSENYYGNFYNGSSYIFEEGGIEFSIFPDGQFDFVYLGRNQGSQVNVSVNTPGVSINFNSGYNYDTYVQYDNYGAVIQVEDVPIYYDEFGRISQAGRVEIRYNDRRIVRVGGLHVFYNNYGYFSHCSGFVSPWYTTYVYRPWHVHYVRPIFSNCVVYDYPYRQYYHPHRYSYAYHSAHYHRGHDYYRNARHDFYRPGSRVHYNNGRTAINKNYRGAKNRSELATRGDKGTRASQRNNSVNSGRYTAQNSSKNEIGTRGQNDGNSNGRNASKSRSSFTSKNSTREHSNATQRRSNTTKHRTNDVQRNSRNKTQKSSVSRSSTPSREKSVQRSPKSQTRSKSSGAKNSRTSTPTRGRG